MSFEELHYHLDNKNAFGVNTKNDSESVAWILLSKRISVNRFFERFSREDNEEAFDQQMDIKREPYCVWFGELSRSVYEANKFLSNEDYIINQNHYFSTLEDVNCFLRSKNVDVLSLKWSADIEFL
jgi:hypothetical protein